MIQIIAFQLVTFLGTRPVFVVFFFWPVQLQPLVYICVGFWVFLRYFFMACYDVNNCRRCLYFIPVGGQVAMWSRGREYMRKWGRTMPKTSQKTQRAIFLANLRPWLAWHKKQKNIPNCGSICLSFQQFAGMLLSGFILCSWKALGPPSTVPGCQNMGCKCQDKGKNCPALPF